jgi:hypothetical protein
MPGGLLTNAIGGILRHRHKNQPPTFGGGPLGSGQTGLTWQDVQPTPRPNPVDYSDLNRWPVSMSPTPSGDRSAGLPPSGPTAVGSGSQTPAPSVNVEGGPVSTAGLPLPGANRLPNLTPTPLPPAGDTPAPQASAPAGGSPAPTYSGFGGTPFRPSTMPGMFQDETGHNTYSHDSAENNQYGYWGKDTFENPFGNAGFYSPRTGPGGGGGGGNLFNYLYGNGGMYHMTVF